MLGISCGQVSGATTLGKPSWPWLVSHWLALPLSRDTSHMPTVCQAQPQITPLETLLVGRHEQVDACGPPAVSGFRSKAQSWALPQTVCWGSFVCLVPMPDLQPDPSISLPNMCAPASLYERWPSIWNILPLLSFLSTLTFCPFCLQSLCPALPPSVDILPLPGTLHSSLQQDRVDFASKDLSSHPRPTTSSLCDGSKSLSFSEPPFPEVENELTIKSPLELDCEKQM